jgi:hypothetical protein
MMQIKIQRFSSWDEAYTRDTEPELEHACSSFVVLERPAHGTTRQRASRRARATRRTRRTRASASDDGPSAKRRTARRGWSR